MKKLDYLELLKLIRKCTVQPKFRGGIFTKSYRDNMRAFTDALDIIRSDDAENAAMLRRTTSTSQNAIEFKNGSVLWFTPEEVLPRLHGTMIDEGLYDGRIKEDFVKEYIAPMERRKDT